MTIRPVDISEIPSQTRNGGESKATALIEEFLASGVEAGEVEGDGYGKGFASALNKSARENDQPVKAVKRGDQMFLMRFDWSDWTPPAPRKPKE